jgi:putative redox-active protein with C_GCAxxG_C_C motif
VGQEKIGQENPELIKAMAGLAGVMARGGHICGIPLGAVVLISSLYGRSSPDEKQNPLAIELGLKIDERFAQMAAEYGGVQCTDISEIDWRDKEQIAWFRTHPDSTRGRCTRLVGEMAAYLGELLDEAAPPEEG